MKSARLQLSEVITHALGERSNLTRANIADRCGVRQDDVADWCTGRTVPTRAAWHRLHKMVCRTLARWGDLHSRALEEERVAADVGRAAMRSVVDQRPIPPFTAVGTNLGDKMRSVIDVDRAPTPALPVVEASHEPAAADPQPAAKPKRPTIPPGARSFDGHQERLDFARAVLVQRPRITIQGQDGLINLLRSRFGIGVSYEAAKRIVDEARGTTPAPADLPDPIPDPTRAKPPEAATSEVSSDDLGAAVSLILGSIPNLQTLTISVDEHGEASVDYQVREVRILTTGGSLKVRR